MSALENLPNGSIVGGKGPGASVIQGQESLGASRIAIDQLPLFAVTTWLHDVSGIGAARGLNGRNDILNELEFGATFKNILYTSALILSDKALSIADEIWKTAAVAARQVAAVFVFHADSKVTGTAVATCEG